MRDELIKITRGLKGRLELLSYMGLTDLPVAGKDRCPACPVKDKNPVKGYGKPGAAIVFVLDRPSKDRIEGRPFDGEEGIQLRKIIQWMASVSKNERFKSIDDAYVTYALKCPVAGDEAARDCKPLLEKEINSINPVVVVALGRLGALSLLDSSDVKNLRGRVHPFGSAALIITHGAEDIIKNADLKKEARSDLELALKEISKRAAI